MILNASLVAAHSSELAVDIEPGLWKVESRLHLRVRNQISSRILRRLKVEYSRHSHLYTLLNHVKPPLYALGGRGILAAELQVVHLLAQTR